MLIAPYHSWYDSSIEYVTPADDTHVLLPYISIVLFAYEKLDTLVVRVENVR